MKRLPLVLSALLFWTSTHAADLVLAAKGRKPVPIIVFKGAPPITRDTAAVLATYIGKITGVKPEVLDGAPATPPEHAIWVGVQPELKALFPKTSFDFQHPEEILLAASEKHLVIAGRDRWDASAFAPARTKKDPAGEQAEYGTANAVYTFLQDHLGVRWFWPGELGEDVSPKEQISVAPFEQRYHPQIRGRAGVFHYSALHEIVGYGQSHDWTRAQRLQLDSLKLEGGHGFGDWWERYHEKHPEIFALQPDGTRSSFPTPRTVKLCMSNPLVWQLWMQEVEAELKANPRATLFNASPNDGWASGHCTCEKCRAWDPPEGEPRSFVWYKQRETRPATSDRDVTFANKLGELLKARYPGKDYKVLMLSYGNSRPAPVKVKPADNVLMSVVANFLGRTGLVDSGSLRGETYRSEFDAWAKIVPEMIWRPNTGSPAGWQQGLPDLSTQQTIRDLKDVAAAGCVGIYIDGVWEHWATLAPQYYVMAQLAWNPKADTAAILDDYYQRAFGPAAGAVREYYETIEKARMAFTAENQDGSVFDFTGLYTTELLDASQARLDKAARALPEGSVYARRVAFVRVGLDYTRLTMANVVLMKGYWKKKDPAVAQQVQANWQALEKLALANPVAINWGPVRSTTPRMQGLHPDNAAKAKKKARTVAADLDEN